MRLFTRKKRKKEGHVQPVFHNMNRSIMKIIDMIT